MPPRPLPLPCAGRVALLALLLLAMPGPTANASGLHLSIPAVQQGSLVVYRLFGVGGKTHAAEYAARLDGVPGIAYSIQLGEPDKLGASQQWRAFGLSAVSGAEDAAYLVLRHAQSSPISPPGSPPLQITALQLAIWELVYDTSPDLGSGNFQVLNADPAAIAGASSLLASLPPSPGNTFDLGAIRHYVFGDVVFASLSTLAVIPEPGTGALVAVGLAGLLAGRRRPA